MGKMWRPWENEKKLDDNENSLEEKNLVEENEVSSISDGKQENNKVPSLAGSNGVREYTENISINTISTRSHRFLDVERKKAVLDVYFKIRNQFGGRGAIQKTTVVTNVPRTTVWRLVTKGVKERKPRKDKGHFKTLTDEHAQIIHCIIKKLGEKHSRLSVKILHEELIKDRILTAEECSVETLRHFLKSRDLFV